jgi:phosphoesterase RecJ-like protein
VNVAELAQRFGGGGHVRASGCTLEGSLQEVTDALIKEVGSMLA